MVGGSTLQDSLYNYYYLVEELEWQIKSKSEYSDKNGYLYLQLLDQINYTESMIEEYKLEIQNMGGSWE